MTILSAQACTNKALTRVFAFYFSVFFFFFGGFSFPQLQGSCARTGTQHRVDESFFDMPKRQQEKINLCKNWGCGRSKSVGNQTGR